MFKIAICDDNLSDLDVLRIGTKQWLEQKSGIDAVVSTFFKSEELKKILIEGERTFDLYLLDIVMGDLDGIDLGRFICKKFANVSIIYITSFQQFALDAYNIHALRYLVKPVDQSELFSALDLAYALFSMCPRHMLLVNGIDSVTSIIMEEIMYVENNLRTIQYTMSNGNIVEGVRRSGTFEEAVGLIAKDSGFLQPHKSYFVNMKYVHSLKSDIFVMDDGKEIPIARRRITEVQNRYIQFVSRGG